MPSKQVVSTLRRWGAVILLLRVVNSLVVGTHFTPDEYWQGPEIAHSMVFGYGHRCVCCRPPDRWKIRGTHLLLCGIRTWEWLPGARIRGFAHPAIYACIYAILQALVRACGVWRFHALWGLLTAFFTQGVDTGFSCWAGPRVLHGLLLGAQDCAVLVLAATLFGDRAGRYALLAHATSWFVAYCGVRTYSNCVEAFLCTLCLAVWPWGRVYTNVSRARLSVCIALAAVSVVMRPTAALLWGPLFAHYLWYEALWCTKH